MSRKMATNAKPFKLGPKQIAMLRDEGLLTPSQRKFSKAKRESIVAMWHEADVRKLLQENQRAIVAMTVVMSEMIGQLAKRKLIK